MLLSSLFFLHEKILKTVHDDNVGPRVNFSHSLFCTHPHHAQGSFFQKELIAMKITASLLLMLSAAAPALGFVPTGIFYMIDRS